MQVQKINNSQPFLGLNIHNVAISDRHIIHNDWKKLLELGEKYDITLTSTYADVPGFSAIDIDVRPLKDGLNFLQSLIRNTGRSTYQEQENKTFMQAVHDAIDSLNKK